MATEDEKKQMETMVSESVFLMDQWYTALQAETLPMKFMSVSSQHLKALYNLYKDSYHRTKLSTAEDAACLEEFEKSADSLIYEATRSSPNQGAVIRLSTRSPKDGVLDWEHNNMLTLLADEVEKLGDSPSDNELLIAFFTAASKAMCVKTGAEALQLLIRSNWVFHDIDKILKYPQPDVSFAARKYVDVNPMFEFRCFVKARKLTAITQYYHHVHFPLLAKNKAQYQEKLMSYFQSNLATAIPIEDCVLDIVLINDVPRVMEIYPHDKRTSGLLFSWQNKADRDVLNGDAPFEMRIVNEPVATIKSFHLYEDPLEKSKQLIKHRRRNKRIVQWGGAVILAATIGRIAYKYFNKK